MKITVPVPQFVAHTVLDYDFQSAKRAKATGKVALLAGLSYVAFPVVLVAATAIDFVADVARSIGYAATDGARQFVQVAKGFYSGAHYSIRSTFREIID